MIPVGEFVKFLITNSKDERTWEKKYPLSLSIQDLRMRLEMLSGIESNAMTIEHFVDKEKKTTIQSSDEGDLESAIGSCVDGEHRLHLVDTREDRNLFDKLEAVPKFELSEEEYNKRSESLRQFKMQLKANKFGGDTFDEPHWLDLMESLKIGDEVIVTIKGKPNRRGKIMFKGKLSLIPDSHPGLWVGVRYNEPVGKNDGSIGGQRFFECEPNHGAFVRPSAVHVLAK